ncbi:MAG: ATP-binding protein [Lachnospiraceae bacterium]
MKKLEQECVKINGKKVLAIGNWQVFTCLAVAEPLDLGRRDSQVSFARYVYVNVMLDTEDSDSQVFLKFIEFVNKMVYFSSTERTDGLVFSSGSRRIFNFICGLDNGVKGLEGFLEEAGIKTALVERDIPGGKTIYCKMGNKEIPFEEVLLSGMEALVILYFWYVQRKDFSFVFIDSFDAFYHTFLSRAVIRKLAAERNIQIIFTSHNTSIISNRLLRPDCYFILEDNTIQPFCDLTNRELKEAHNLQKMYVAVEFTGNK